MSTRADAVWSIEAILRWTVDFFGKKGLETPRLDAEVLLAHVLERDRVYIYTHYDQPLTASERERYRGLVVRRARCEPIAYIVGAREFFGRAFHVDPRVLIPRPETEHVVEAALAWARRQPQGPDHPWRILDVGSGSGALALTLAAELPASQVVATDVSQDALAVTRGNRDALRLGERVQCVHSDLFAALPDTAAQFDIVVSNPPYIEAAAPLMADVAAFEPDVALRAGPDGFAVLGPLCMEVFGRLASYALFACEVGHTQADAVTRLLRHHGSWHGIDTVRDLQGHQRVVCAERQPARRD